MTSENGVSSLAIDLTRLLRRTVTSFYSNLVTRPTGRAIRMGVESQISEVQVANGVCLSVLDFSQVHVLDYSCADEIVAKLLLRFVGEDRPTQAYFLARGLQEHQMEAVEAVLERHSLLLVAQDEEGVPQLLGPSNPLERACWGALTALGRATAPEVAERAGLAEDAVRAAIDRLLAQRVVVAHPAGVYSPLTYLLRLGP
jgi:hypothetical protein